MARGQLAESSTVAHVYLSILDESLSEPRAKHHFGEISHKKTIRTNASDFNGDHCCAVSATIPFAANVLPQK